LFDAQRWITPIVTTIRKRTKRKDTPIVHGLTAMTAAIAPKRRRRPIEKKTYTPRESIQQSSFHLTIPQHSESSAGMHASGSKAARKSPFVGN
jgi:hypothetical protein